MFAFTSRFTLLAAFCCLAAISQSPSTNAVVVERHSGAKSHMKDNSVADGARHHDPKSPTALPAPMAIKDSVTRVGHEKDVKQGHHKHGARHPLEPSTGTVKNTISHSSRHEKEIIIEDPLFVYGTPFRHFHEHMHIEGLSLRSVKPSTTISTRQEPNEEGTLQGTKGNIAVMSNNANGNSTQIGSLCIKANETTIDICERDSTSFQMMLVQSISDYTYLMHLSPADNECIAFEDDPSKLEPMSTETCNNGTSNGSGRSQMFEYNGKTREVHPARFNNQTTTSSAADSQQTSTNVSERRDSNDSPTNVTLVFVPTGQVSVEDVNSGSATTATFTETITTTVTISSTSMTGSSSTAVPAGSLAVLDVEIVGPSSSTQMTSSTSMVSPTSLISSSSSTASSTAVDGVSIASQIATSNSASSSTVDSSSVVPSSTRLATVAQRAVGTETHDGTESNQWMFKV